MLPDLASEVASSHPTERSEEDGPTDEELQARLDSVRRRHEEQKKRKNSVVNGMEETAATTLQRVARGKAGRKIMGRKKKVKAEQHAAVTLQRVQRGRAARQSVEERHGSLQAAKGARELLLEAGQETAREGFMQHSDDDAEVDAESQYGEVEAEEEAVDAQAEQEETAVDPSEAADEEEAQQAGEPIEDDESESTAAEMSVAVGGNDEENSGGVESNDEEDAEGTGGNDEEDAEGLISAADAVPEGSNSGPVSPQASETAAGVVDSPKEHENADEDDYGDDFESVVSPGPAESPGHVGEDAAEDASTAEAAVEDVPVGEAAEASEGGVAAGSVTEIDDYAQGERQEMQLADEKQEAVTKEPQPAKKALKPDFGIKKKKKW